MFVCDTLQAELMENARVFHYARRDMEDMARTFGLLPHLEKHPYDLSSGEMQKAAIAKLLLLQPNVLLLDEPTKGMDAMAKDELAYLLKQLAASGMAVVIVTHDLEFAASHAPVSYTHLGMDARQYVDVLAQLPVARLNTVNAQAFALLAYDSGNYTLPSLSLIHI